MTVTITMAQVVLFILICGAGLAWAARSGRRIVATVAVWLALIGYTVALVRVGSELLRAGNSLYVAFPEGPEMGFALLLGWVPGVVAASIGVAIHRKKARTCRK